MKSIALIIVITCTFLMQNSYSQGVVWRDVPSSELGGVASSDLAGRMRASMAYATKYGFGAGVPTFHQAEKNGEIVYGTTLIPKEYADFKDIPATELGNAGLDDFQERVRQAMTWATNHGYGAGVPTFFHADKGRGIVYGVILIKADKVVFNDIKRSWVRSFDYADTADWMRVATDYAAKNTFSWGFPTFHIASKGYGNEVFGEVFLKK